MHTITILPKIRFFASVFHRNNVLNCNSMQYKCIMLAENAFILHVMSGTVTKYYPKRVICIYKSTFHMI